jgi:Ndr family
MGGYVAFAFWRRHAERVQALVLADTKSTTDSESAREKRQQLIVDAEGSANAHNLTDAMVPGQLGETTRSAQPEIVARVQAMLHRATPRAVADGSRAMLARHDSTDTLATITVPVLVLVGDEDTLTPLSDAIAMASGIARSRLVTVPGAGHLAPLEQPTIVNAAIAEFLDVSEISAAYASVRRAAKRGTTVTASEFDAWCVARAAHTIAPGVTDQRVGRPGGVALLNTSRLICTYFCIAAGTSSSGKMAVTGHSGSHAPQSMHSSGWM